MVSPLLKWPGGKTRFASSMMQDLLPDDFVSRVYVEPMVGGAAAFLAHGVRAKSAILSDVNVSLIETYRAVRDHRGKVMAELLGLDNLTKVQFLGLRDEFNSIARRLRASTQEPGDAVRLSALMIAMNFYGFNGLYRENSSGDNNVPYGDSEAKKVTDKYPDGMVAFSEALDSATLRSGPVHKITLWCPENAFLFVDPPYVTSGEFEASGNFTSYHSSGFSESDLRVLSWALKKVVGERGAKVMLTHSDTPVARDVFSWMEPHEFASSYSINAHGNKSVTEVAFTSY